MTTKLSERINALSPQQRALLELRLKQAQSPFAKSLTIPKREQWNNCPLSLDQENLWLIDQLEPGLPVYNLSTSFNLGGALDMAALTRTLDEIVRRHEVLRTCIHSADGMPVQFIASSLTIPIPVINLESLSDSDRALELKQLTNQFTRQPFNLNALPLLRVALVRLREHEHIMLMTVHHIIIDRWSFSILWRELTTLYEAFVAGQPATLPELPIQFADFALWQRQRLQGELLQAQLAFWRKQLEGASSVIPLPTDRPRPPLQTYEGERQYWKPDPEVWNKIKALSQQEGVTLYMLMLAAFGLLLYRYSGQDDINIGTPYANRHLVETEGLIGYLLNMLLLRVNLSGNPTFKALLVRVREVTLNAYDYSEVPFAKIVEDLQPQRDLSCNPLFQVAYIHHDLKNKIDTQPTLSLKGLEVEACTSIFDLTLGLRDEPGNPTLIVEYKTRLFDTVTIARLRDHFDALLDSIVNSPQRPLSELQMLSEAEQHQLLVEFNDTDHPYPQDLCLHQLFEQQVARTPTARALTFNNEHVTYAELNARANQLAHYLQAQGIGLEDRVGVLLERSVEMVVSVLAILKLGAAYVPLDPAYPQDHLAFMIADSQLRLICTHTLFAEKFSAAGAQQLCLDTDSTTLSAQPANNPACTVLPENPAYAVYTSGSTGRAKGVLNSHRGAVNRFFWMWERYPFEAGEVCCHKTSLSFADSVWEIFGPLLQGIPSIIISNTEVKDVERFVGILNQARVTRIVLVPSLLRALLESRHDLSDQLAAMKYISCSGEAIDIKLWQQLRQRLPESILINLYGSSEVSADVTSYDSREGQLETCVPIGRPISNTNAYILNDWMETVAPSFTGEVYIGGDGLARGYMNQPALTAERFVPHPYSKEPGARLYRTGDRGRYLADGNIEYQGRADYQVKIRGFRIELGEIESVLMQHAEVREAVVAAQEGVDGQQRLVGYVVAETSEKVSTSELRIYLSQKLPEHMIPSLFIVLDELPLTPNGKVDRRALPAPDASRPEQEDAYIAPRTPAEELIASIWQQVLGVDRVGIHDNFFALGGHSLLATQVVSRLRRTFSVELPLRALFESPTVIGLADYFRIAASSTSTLTPPSLRPVSRTAPLPLSFAQQRLWFLQQLEPESTSYNLPLAVRLSGALNQSALQRSLGEIVWRHEALRTTFSTVDSEPVQVIHPETDVLLPLIDLSALGVVERAREIERLSAEEAGQVFSLESGPLLRARVVRQQQDEHVVLFTMHHIISDGWSMGVLIKEVADLYTAYAVGRKSELAELSIQYADYAAWQREWLQGEVLEAELQYWREQLAGAPAVLELPTDRPRPATPSHRGARHSFAIEAGVRNQLEELTRREGVTMFMLLLGAFQVLLSRYSGQAEVVVGSPIANRNRAETEELIGFFVNTLALRVSVVGEARFEELLRQVREVCLGAYAHQDVPFEKLVEELEPERSLSHTPVFQVMLVLQNAPQGVLELPGLELQGLAREGQTAKFDLTLTMVETPNGINASIEYSTDLFDSITIERMSVHFRTLLESIAATPQQRISDLQMLSKAERHQLLVEFNDTHRSYPQDICLYQLFEQQVARTPDSLALTFQNESLTYAELNARANQLAHHLRAQGIGIEDRVGILLERSVEMVVSLLGILKAGAAYVPLDPAYPQDRLAFMAADARLSLLLTHPHLVAHISAPGTLVVGLDPHAVLIANLPTTNPACEVSPSALAYVIYTSGSTGQPKGTMVEHRSVANYLNWANRALTTCRTDILPQISSLSFDASLKQLLAPLLRGGKVWMLSEDAARQPEQLLKEISVHTGVTLNCVPSLWSALLDVIESGVIQISRESLTKLLVGGERLDADLIERTFRLLPHLQVWNLYGPTETTANASFARILPHGEVSIGRPIDNTQIYILSADLIPVPVGVAGVIYVGGAGLARGYLQRPDLTAEVFIPHPYSERPGERLYRTGDVGRYLRDGKIEYLGRADHQVKIRGFRIELGEIEAALAQCSQIRKAVVVVQKSGMAVEDGQQRLIGYVVADAGTQLQTNQLRKQLAKKLPEYMIPSAFIQLAELPLAPGGKVDRRALPPFDNASSEMADRFVAPTTPLENELVQMWTALLGVERIGIEDNFFELGGHSLLAMQVISRVRADYDLEISLRDFFEVPTVGHLAELVEAAFVSTLEGGGADQLLTQMELTDEADARQMLRLKQGGIE